MSGRSWLIAQLDAMHQSRGGDWYYRTFAPGRAMAELDGVYVVNVDQAHRKLPTIVECADVLVINGACSADLLPVIAKRKAARQLTVFEINDDVQEIQASNPLASFFQQPENLRLFRRLALSADAVQYSVPELQRIYGSLNARGRVFLNQVVAPPPLRTPDAAGDVTIGWGGSAGHLEDLAEIAPSLRAFVLSQPNVTLHLMCSDKIWQLFDALPSEKKRRTPIGSIDDYYRFVSQLDIGIAPNRDRGFNRARSDVKFLEFAGWGAVPVVQRLAPYAESVKDGDNGFSFATVDELIGCLTRLVSDAGERQRVRARAHAYVVSERLQSTHAAERLAFYASVLPEAAANASAPQRFAELSALDGAEISGRHLMLAHSRYESLLHDGIVALQGGQERERGVALLREAVRLEPTQALPDLFLGVQLDSEPELLAALAKNPRSVQAALALGTHYLERSQHKQALERFLSAAEMAPGYEMPFLHAARTLQRLGSAKEAGEFGRLAESMAAAVAPPRAPVVSPAPVASPARAAAALPSPSAPSTVRRPAWHLLESGVHLQTLDRNYAPTALLEMIERTPRRVLDLGCFCGGTGRFLKQRFPACEVVGIEMLEPAAALAAEVYDRVLVGTLEQIDFEKSQLLPQSFDVIVLADVLEHLFNPWQALTRLRPLLAPDGELFISLPNLRNLKLLSDLARGRFDYEGHGILDVTHVRFFTRNTAVEMLEQTGFVVEDIRMNPDQRLAAVYEGKVVADTTSIELDGLKLSGLAPKDLLELAALQLYFRARSS